MLCFLSGTRCVLFVSLLLALVACGPAPRDPLRVATLPWPGYESMHLARNLGYLDEHEVRLVELVNNSQITAALRNGNVAAATVTLDSALALMQDGVDLRVVLVMNVSRGADAVMARPGITELQQLRGKRIAVENAAVGGVMLDALLNKAGVPVADVQLVSLTVNEHLAAYRRGEVDVVVTFEPTVTFLQQDGARRLFDSRDVPGRIMDVLVVRRELVTRYRPALQHLILAHFRAQAYLEWAPGKAHEHMAPYLGVTPDMMPALLEGIQLSSLTDNHRLLNGKTPELVNVAGTLATFMATRQLLREAPPVNHIALPDFLPPSNSVFSHSPQQVNP